MSTPTVWEGRVFLTEVDRKNKQFATNKLDGAILATPAIVDGNIYVRTESHLHAFGN